MDNNTIDIDELRVIKCRVNHLLEGKTLLQYLVDRFSYNDKATWQSEIKEGRIKFNGKLEDENIIVKCGDEISYLPEKLEEPEVDLSFNVLYEDEFILVVEKSGNLPTHPAGIYMVNTLWFQLRKKYGVVYPVNRLDMETSGLLIFTRDSKLAGKLAQQKMSKSYYVLVHGEFPESIEANGYIFQDLSSTIRKKRKFAFESLEAEENGLKFETSQTTLELIKTNKEFSLVKATLNTGRTHQIRATMLSLGFPVVGDKIYGLDESFFIKRKEDLLTDDDWAKMLLKRQALHSYYLKFYNPNQEKEIEFRSELPKEIARLINNGI